MDESPTLTLTRWGKSITVAVRTDRYQHGGTLAVQLIDTSDGEHFATVSVNVEGVALAGDEFVFKTYSENEGLLEAMLAAGLVELTGRSCDIGPVCRLVKPAVTAASTPGTLMAFAEGQTCLAVLKDGEDEIRISFRLRKQAPDGQWAGVLEMPAAGLRTLKDLVDQANEYLESAADDE